MKKLSKIKKPRINKEQLVEQADKMFIILMLVFFAFILVELVYFIYGFDLIGQSKYYVNSFYTYFQSQAATLSSFQLIFFFGVAALFFLPSPLELFYYNFLDQGVIHYKLYMAALIGLFIAQHFNYWFGRLFSSYIEKHLKEKKLERYKRRLEKYGGYAVFIMHVFPLPYSIFNAVVGLTGYSYKKWLRWAFSALAINYLFITILYFVLF